jgi:uncharacterized protein (DUF488 family)
MENTSDLTNRTIFTIGHSNQSLDDFIKLLIDNNIEVLVDVRSYPRSKFSPQFDSEVIEKAVSEKGIKYLYFGKELGGRPMNPSYYDQEGHVLYKLIAESDAFQKYIQRLITGVEKNHKIALMCSEEDPKYCHRSMLIGRVLNQHGVKVLHIRSNGRVQDKQEISGKSRVEDEGYQLALIAKQEDDNWRSAKSIRSVSQNEKPRNSLRP